MWANANFSLNYFLLSLAKKKESLRTWIFVPFSITNICTEIGRDIAIIRRWWRWWWWWWCWRLCIFHLFYFVSLLKMMQKNVAWNVRKNTRISSLIVESVCEPSQRIVWWKSRRKRKRKKTKTKATKEIISCIYESKYTSAFSVWVRVFEQKLLILHATMTVYVYL